MSDAAQIGPAEDFEDLFEQAPCGYLVLDAAGAIVRANATLAGWLGAEAAALTGKRLRDLLTTPGRIFYETNFAPALRLHGSIEELALDLAPVSGKALPVLVSARERRDDAARLVATRVVIVRAKDRRDYERDLLRREAAVAERLSDEKATSELREQFIAVLGHDLRNPLASIAGASPLLRREPLSDKAMSVLRLMEASVDRMAGLIDDVMDFARGRLGSGIVIERKIAELEPVLSQVVAELEIDAPSRVFDSTYSLIEPVSFDESRLAQLVSNLLGNALSHGDPKSPVSLRAATDAGRLTISVANAGSPIPPEALERLFQPFFRGDVRQSRQGLGLGLHIASEIARAHGGELSVCSDDVETCFTLTMPCRSPED